MDKFKELENLEKEEQTLTNRLHEIAKEKRKILTTKITDYTGKLICITYKRKSWSEERYILVKSQDYPQPSGDYCIFGQTVVLHKDSKENLVNAQLLDSKNGSAWITRDCVVKEVSKDEVIKITSELGEKFWNTKI